MYKRNCYRNLFYLYGKTFINEEDKMYLSIVFREVLVHSPLSTFIHIYVFTGVDIQFISIDSIRMCRNKFEILPLLFTNILDTGK